MLAMMPGGQTILILSGWDPNILQTTELTGLTGFFRQFDHVDPLNGWTLWIYRFILASLCRIVFCFTGSQGVLLAETDMTIYTERARLVSKSRWLLYALALRSLAPTEQQ